MTKSVKEVTCVAGIPTGAWALPAQSAGASYAACPGLEKLEVGPA